MEMNTKTIYVPESPHPRVVVIGGGFAGINVVKHLKNKNVQVVLFNDHNFHLFQPLLYQVSTFGLEPDSVCEPLRKLFRGFSNVIFRMAEVTDVYPSEKRIQTSIGALSYDYLVIATGSQSNFFGLEGKKDLFYSLKTLEDGTKTRRDFLKNLEQAAISQDSAIRDTLLTTVIVGGGPAGVELAGALAEFNTHILGSDYPELASSKRELFLIEATGKLLGTMCPESSAAAYEKLKQLGVKILLNQAVQDYDGSVLKVSDHPDISTKMVVWTAGVKARIPAIHDGEASQSRLLVNEYGQLLNHPDVFAIGDVAKLVCEDYPNGYPMLAPVAMQQAKCFADNLGCLLDQKPMKPFVYNNQGIMATIGRSAAVVELGRFKSQGFFAWCIWIFVHLLSIVGFNNKMVVLVNWIISYFTYDKKNRIIS